MHGRSFIYFIVPLSASVRPNLVSAELNQPKIAETEFFSAKTGIFGQKCWFGRLFGNFGQTLGPKFAEFSAESVFFGRIYLFWPKFQNIRFLPKITANFSVSVETGKARFYLYRWKYGILGWSSKQSGGILKSKSTQPSIWPRINCFCVASRAPASKLMRRWVLGCMLSYEIVGWTKSGCPIQLIPMEVQCFLNLYPMSIKSKSKLGPVLDQSW